MPLSLSVMFDLLVAVLNRELRSSLRRCEANGHGEKRNVVFLFTIALIAFKFLIINHETTPKIEK